MERQRAPLIRWLALAFSTLALLLVAPMALAAGKVDWKSKTVKEADKAWKVEVSIYLGKPPDVPTLPMKFEFTPKVYYERSMLDGDKLVERKVPLENKQSLIENVDVGFLDPGSGKIEKRTRFVFKLTRGLGYEAGEYDVTIRDGRSGDTIGSHAHLVLQGENELIDRRAMVFTGAEKKKKKPDQPAESGAQAANASDGSGSESGSSEASETKASEESEPPANERPPAENSESASAETVKKKPGGCGCHLVGAGSSSSLAGVPALLGLLAFAVRRRRSVQATRSIT